MRNPWPPAVLESSLFRGLPAAERDEVLAASVERRLPRGGVLFRQGEAVEALYLVAGGRVKLAQTAPDGSEVIVRALVPGEIVAAVAMLDKRAYPVTATAITPCRVLLWPRPVAMGLAAAHPALRVNAMSTVADRMQESFGQIRRLVTDSAERRVAQALLRLARSGGRPGADGVMIEQGAGRRELAEMAGTSMFTASRILARWAREGLVGAGRERVLVRSLERLEEIGAD